VRITESAVSLNVADEGASADFLRRHFGFREVMRQDGFVSLARDDAGFNVIYLRTGLSTFRPPETAGHCGGLLLVFVVDDIDAEYERIVAEGAPVAVPIETEPWGERFFSVFDPNGVTIQLVQWLETPLSSPT
jgi:uncharacterized glyoxalase superfamily protein PhnB